jgi:toxin ParE1/3/4
LPASRSPGRTLRISEPAAADLSGIAAYTERVWGAAQKSRYLAEIQAALVHLRDTPAMGRTRDEIAENLRSFPVGRHVVYLRDTETTLLIVRILHQNMDPERRLKTD